MGSSPLTRGKPRGRPGWLGPEGLIPAHAGKTWRCGRTPAGARAHPRSRGENLAAQLETVGDAGSSPLTRGKAQHTHPGQQARRLIPAHAGKTNVVISPCLARRAHPRSRGENAVEMEPAVVRTGSSPLTRGKHYGADGRRARRGLIPAHAGKTSVTGQGQGRDRAHPRSRGENSLLAPWSLTASGSSPLTRGKHGGDRKRRQGGRLIPAHAGKTVCCSPCRRSRWAHPRSRGENKNAALLEMPVIGSSPLTRGKREDRHPRLDVQRLIPAHAGKTTAPYDGRDRGRAHPRSRGENWVLGFVAFLSIGLIPAHAGKTCGPGSRRARLGAHPRSRGENPAACRS